MSIVGLMFSLMHSIQTNITLSHSVQLVTSGSVYWPTAYTRTYIFMHLLACTNLRKKLKTYKNFIMYSKT